MAQIFEIIKLNETLLVAVNIVAVIISLLLLFILFVKHARLKRKYKGLVRGMDNKNLEGILIEHMDRVDLVVNRMEEVSKTCDNLRAIAQKSVQKLGVVRFNAFSDTGSDLSFAVALLDYFGDGVIISSIFGRDDQRTYVKPVKGGASSYHLSDEEIKAIKQALNQ